MKKLLPLLALICSTGVFAQSPWIVNETFPETKIKWLVTNDVDYVTRVTNNGYDIESLSTKSAHVFGDFAIHNNIDFLIEASVTALHTATNVGYGILFGCNRSDKPDGYSFEIAENGHYTVRTLSGVNIIEPHQSKYITVGPNAVNKLKVLQLSDKWMFFINDNQVDFVKSGIIFGEDAGFTVGGGGHASFTSFKVYDMTAAKKQSQKPEPWYAIDKYDNFNNNDDKWIVDENEDHKFSFDGGYLIQRKSKKGSSFIYDHALFHESDDYMAEVEVEHVDGTDEFSYGLLWGEKEGDNRFEFKITASGYFRINKVEDGKVTVIQDYTESKYIKQGNGVSNIVTLKKINNTWFFYINDREVYNCPAQKLFGDKAGLVVYELQTIKLHSLKTAKLMYSY